MSTHPSSYLALGDSYTIGESCAIFENFPYVITQILRKQNHPFLAPEIVAKTGWTTFELAEHLIHTSLLKSYDFVSLLIGVNNQYRGLSITDFKSEFQFLLQKAIHFASNKKNHVVVLTIPDWSKVPFAEGRDRHTISNQIFEYNRIIQEVCAENQIKLVDITTDSLLAETDDTMLAHDKLHYSANQHTLWAEKVAEYFSEVLLSKS